MAKKETKNPMHRTKLNVSMSTKIKYEYIAMIMVNMIYGPREMGKSDLGPVTNVPLR